MGVDVEAEAGLEVDKGGARLLMVSSWRFESRVRAGGAGKARRSGFQGCNSNSSVRCTSSMTSVNLPVGVSPSSDFSDPSFSNMSELSSSFCSLCCCFVSLDPSALYRCTEKLGRTSEKTRAS